MKTLIIVLSLALASASLAAVAAVAAAAAAELPTETAPTSMHGLGLLLDTEKSPVGSIYSQGPMAS